MGWEAYALACVVVPCEHANPNPWCTSEIMGVEREEEAIPTAHGSRNVRVPRLGSLDGIPTTILNSCMCHVAMHRLRV
jgi:hypothetical protein